jgi:hypothetical protein
MRPGMLPTVISLIAARKTRWASTRLLAVSLSLVLLLGAVPLSAATRSHSSAHKSSTHKSSTQKASKRRTRNARSTRRHRSSGRYARRSRRCRGGCGQREISRSRTLEIQQALIRQKYLTPGQDSGEWDETTKEALARYQGDNQWQTKILPDSRALIKLGLGPKRKNLLNPETAAIGMRSLALLNTADQNSSEQTGESLSN